MLHKIYSAVNEGLKSNLVEVETDVSKGFPAIEIVGLPDKAVSEAKERVRSAIVNSGFKFLPGNKKRLIINLAPADIKKEGPIYDLPIALGVLMASEEISLQSDKEKNNSQDKSNNLELEDSLFVGELSLNGELRHTKGVLPMALLAKKKGLKNIFIPKQNVKEVSLVEGINIYPVESLKDLAFHLLGQKQIKPIQSSDLAKSSMLEKNYKYDFGYIKGQEFIKRALEIAAAGGHNVLMIGSPGSGKTLLARAMPSILPSMAKREILEVTKIYSIAGLLKQNEYLKSQRPFRSPHHTASDVALVGGGQIPHPGEVTLSHRGVLFLDELAHFKKQTLESLRQPLEDGEISVARAHGSFSFPAKFILVASMNPCPCGYYGDPDKECKCSAGDITRYRRKISGPFLDRIDLHLQVPRVKIDKLVDKKVAESSKNIRQRVENARQYQNNRFKKLSKKGVTITNSEMNIPQIKEFCEINKKAENLLKQAIEKFTLSARAYHRILKVARTIADLDKSDKIKTEHIAESVQYRTKMNEEIF